MMTKKDFLDYLTGVLNKSTCSDFDMGYLYKKGIIEEIDIRSLEEAITKKDAARIIHQTLILLLEEADEKDWKAATGLQDLYDCHACVGHIAQTFVKGIIDASRDNLFGSDERIETDKAKLFIDRAFDKDKRFKLKQVMASYTEISLIEVNDIIKKEGKTHFIDVRNEADEVFNGYKHFPLKKLLQNPYCITDNKNEAIVLRCENGYQASIAGNLLLDHGYNRIYVVTNH